MHIRRQAESGFHFFLEVQIERRQGRTQAERSRRQQHVLNHRINRRPRCASRRAAFEARDGSTPGPHGCGRRDIPPRRVVAEIVPGSCQGPVHQTGTVDNRSSQARLYKTPTASLTFGSRITRNRQRCMVPPLGAQTPASRILRISSFGHRVWFQPSHRPRGPNNLEQVRGIRGRLGHPVSSLT